ncbi:MAG: glycosyltransferase [Desulfovibrio sp.]|nr:glycosyltransferase [Desulfovibrio sp.]
MPEPCSVLFLMEDLCYGGTQRQTLELARRLDRERFAPSMLMLTGPTDLDAVASGAGIPLHYLGSSRSVARLFFLRLGPVLKRLAPDILVPCTALPNIWGPIWGRIDGIPVIVGTCRGGGSLRRQHEWLLWRLCDHHVCNSRALVEGLRKLGVPAGRISYIPNGVDTERFRPAPEAPSARPPLILCVARLAQDKGHMTLLRAFAIVARQVPEARLRLVGDGPQEVQLRMLARTFGLEERVEFVPGSPDVREHYAEARIFALASVREGQPNVILEAMSCGLPVCATAVGGIPGLVENGVTGLLSPAGFAEALAASLLRLLGDPPLGDALGRAGRARVERDFSFAAMVGAHEELFDRLHRGRRGGHEEDDA